MTNPEMTTELRMLAGLLVGTSWHSQRRGRDIKFTRVEVGESEGIDYLRLTISPRGDINVNEVSSDIKSGDLEPLSADADAAYSFVRGDD